MPTFKADLHCHSTCSDGSLSPQELVKLATEKGLFGLSITDHDSVEAYCTAIPEAKSCDLNLITGVEFSAAHQGHSIHILGYGFDVHHPSIVNLCKWHSKRREERNASILRLLAENNMPLEATDIISALPTPQFPLRMTIGRPHIALAMIQKGYVESLQEAFKKFLGENKLCYVQGKTYSVDDTLEAIHQAKGVAVIAHPHLIKNSTLLNAMLNKPFDGIECYYGNFAADYHKRWLKIAQRRGWIVTGGSDFHGTPKPTISLGCSGIQQHDFNKLLERIAARQ